METDLGQGHVECGKCSTSDAAAADGLRRKITAWTRTGGSWIRKGQRDGKRGGQKKKVCV